jgi:hypothetical protein
MVTKPDSVVLMATNNENALLACINGKHEETSVVCVALGSSDRAEKRIFIIGTLLGSIGTSKRDANYARLFMLAVDTSKQRGGIGCPVW